MTLLNTWTSELWVSNRSDYPVELFSDVTCTVICPRIASGAPFPKIGAKTAERISPLDAGGNMGYLYYLQKGGSEHVDFSLHFADISRSAQNAGTELGVVRERDRRRTRTASRRLSASADGARRRCR